MIRQTVRSLRRDWVFSLAAIAILSVAIAANTSVFTLMNTILFKPLPYKSPEQLVKVQEMLPDLLPQSYPLSAPDVVQLRERVRGLSELAAHSGRDFDLSGAIEPTRISGMRLEAQAWHMVGATPLLGRLYDAEEDRRRERHLVLSYPLWQRLFGADPNIIGRGIDVDRRAYTITAVMPKGFVYPPPSLQSDGKIVDAWLPMSFTKAELAAVGDNFGYKVIGRIAPGISPALLREDLARAAREIRATYPADFPGKTLAFPFSPLLDDVVGNVRGLFMLLLACVGGILLIGCANVASLMLAKAVGRQTEYAVRKALGASTLSLMRQSFAEAIALAIPGAVIGLFLASWSIEILTQLAPAGLPRLEEVSLDWRVAGFTFALSLLSALLFALAPAWQASRTNPGQVHSGSRAGSQSRASLRLGHALVSLEVALCFMLLGATGLMVQTYRNLIHTDPGFAPTRLLTFEVEPRAAAYGEDMAKRKVFFNQLDQKLAILPAVEALSFASSAPLESGWQRIFLLEGQTELSPKTPQISHHFLISPGHIQTIGGRILRGREFTPVDREGSTSVCLINDTLARKFFPGVDPVGKRIKLGGPGNAIPPALIVGVVANLKANDLNEDPALETFQPILQNPSSSRIYFLRTKSEPGMIASAARDMVRSLDPDQVVARLRTMQEVIDSKAASRRFQMLLLSVFGAAALLLAVTGIFGVIANTIRRQTREIGIRMALGASPLGTLRLIMSRSLKPVAIGLVIGLAGLFAAGKSLEAFLYGVKPEDPIALGMAAGIMLFAALIAMWLPVRRAVSVNPSIALRAD